MLLDLFRLDGKTAIVTGAGKGIGAGIAEDFAQVGAKVACLARTEDDLNAVVRRIERSGGAALAVPCDVTDSAQVERAVARTLDALGGVDVLVNNAGAAGPGFGPVEQVDVDAFDKTLRINLSSAYAMVHHCARALRRSGGAVVNISSAMSWLGDPCFAAYAAAKAGMNQMTRVLAQELAPAVRVNCIAPGAVETPGSAAMLRDPQSRATAEFWIPAGRIGQPRDISLAALYFASAASRFVSGKTLEVDGGLAPLSGGAIETRAAQRKAKRPG